MRITVRLLCAYQRSRLGSTDLRHLRLLKGACFQRFNVVKSSDFSRLDAHSAINKMRTAYLHRMSNQQKNIFFTGWYGLPHISKPVIVYSCMNGEVTAQQ